MSMKRGSILRIEVTERLTPVFGGIELEGDRAAPVRSRMPIVRACVPATFTRGWHR